MTGTDLEVEMIGRVEVEVENPGEITVPARKLVDICKEISEDSAIQFSLRESGLEISSGRFRSTLSTLDVSEFPSVNHADPLFSASIDGKAFKKLLDKTSFAMAHQDVRYFLNGMLVEFNESHVRAVATDGHRLALSDLKQDGLEGDSRQVILPRKGVIEIQRLLHESEGNISLTVGSSHLCAASSVYTSVSYTHLTLPTKA